MLGVEIVSGGHLFVNVLISKSAEFAPAQNLANKALSFIYWDAVFLGILERFLYDILGH